MRVLQEGAADAFRHNLVGAFEAALDDVSEYFDAVDDEGLWDFRGRAKGARVTLFCPTIQSALYHPNPRSLASAPLGLPLIVIHIS